MEFASLEIPINRPITIEEGKTYVIEVDKPLTLDRIEKIQQMWADSTKSKCVILDAGAKVAREQNEADLREQIAKEIEARSTGADKLVWMNDALKNCAAIARGEK